MTTTPITTLFFNFVFFFFFFSFLLFKKKMDHILLHIPRIATLQLKDIFYKEEEFKNSKGNFCFQCGCLTFLKELMN